MHSGPFRAAGGTRKYSFHHADGDAAIWFAAWIRITHYVNFLFLVLLIRSGVQILMDHPRLYWNVHCTPGTEWIRFTADAVHCWPPAAAHWRRKVPLPVVRLLLPRGRHGPEAPPIAGLAPLHVLSCVRIGYVLDAMNDVGDLASRPDHRRVDWTPIAFLKAAALRRG